jgi:hypothetical protein
MVAAHDGLLSRREKRGLSGQKPFVRGIVNISFSSIRSIADAGPISSTRKE